MSIDRIIVKNYKSLKELKLDLNPFMVFIGPNNAGKSNIFDCFQFLLDFTKNREDTAAKKRGGFEQIVFNGDSTKTISIELQGSVNVKKKRHYRYFIELEGDRWGGCYNKREFFSLISACAKDRKGDEKKLLEFPVEQRTAIARDDTGKKTGSIGAGRNISYLSQFSDQEHYPILGHFLNQVQNWAFFNLLPPLMRESLPVRKELRLQPLGENLPVVLHVLQTEYPKRFKEIEDILKTALPELEELTTGLTAHEAGQTYIRIKEKGLTTSIPAWGMSDGALRLLGCLATLYLPIPPSLVCFEEPENYVHPRLLKLIVDLLKNASERTQVLVATHSPYLVDFLEPKDLFIVEKKNGETKIKKAEDKKGIKEALKTLGLGEMWYSGSLGGIPLR